MTTLKQRSMLESRLQAYLINKCRKAGAFAVKLESPSRRGFPDVLIIYDGHHLFVELKNELKGRLSFPQQRVIAELEQAGAEVHVLFGLAEVNNWLEQRGML
jgi:Holliday junction resolvase